MSSSTFGRRPFLVGSGLSLGALLMLPSLAAGAAGKQGRHPAGQAGNVEIGGRIDRHQR